MADILTGEKTLVELVLSNDSDVLINDKMFCGKCNNNLSVPFIFVIGTLEAFL